jgi:hypothetical protein
MQALLPQAGASPADREIRDGKNYLLLGSNDDIPTTAVLLELRPSTAVSKRLGIVIPSCLNSSLHESRRPSQLRQAIHAVTLLSLSSITKRNVRR